MVTREETGMRNGEDLWRVTAVHFEPVLRQALGELDKDPATVGRVASLGYGMFTEVGALDKVFPSAEIEGIDVDEKGTLLRERGKIPARVGLRHQDLVKTETLGEDRYDLLVIRNPDIHRSYGWKRIFKNSFRALKSTGGILVTGHTEREIDESAKLSVEAGFQIVFKGENTNVVPREEHAPFGDVFMLVAKKQ